MDSGPNPTRQGILRHDLLGGTTPSHFFVGEYARLIRHSQINKENNNNFPFETKMGIIKTKMCLLNRCHSMIPKSGGECACG